MKFLNKLKGEKFKYRLNAAVIVAGVLIAAILLNVVVSTLADKIPMQLDITSNKIFALTEETKTVLDTLEKDVNIYYLVQPGGEQQYVEKTLDMYKIASNKLKIKNVDIVADPLFGADYKARGINVSVGSVLVECGDRAKMLEYVDMLDIGYTEEGSMSVSGFKLEQKLTNAINYVISDAETKAYFTKGHGELGYSTMAEVLAEENIITAEIDLKTADVPSDAAIVYIMGPSADFSAEELERIDIYLSKGGRLNITLDPVNGEAVNIAQYLSEFWGVTVNRDILVENDASMMMSGNPLFLLPNLVSHDITDKIMSGGVNIVWPSSITFNTKTTPGVSFSSIVESSNSAVARNVNSPSVMTPQPDDRVGKHTLALAVTRANPSMPETRIVLCGTTQFYNVVLLNDGSVANRDLLYGILRYLTNGDANVLSIAPKKMETATLAISDARASAYMILFGTLPAILVLGAGLWMWIRRRHM